MLTMTSLYMGITAQCCLMSCTWEMLRRKEKIPPLFGDITDRSSPQQQQRP